MHVKNILGVLAAATLVTGGGSGIGESFAKYWVKNGGKVVLGDVVPEAVPAAGAEGR